MKKHRHDWYISDGKFKGQHLVKAEETCEKCGKKRWVKVEPYMSIKAFK